MEILQRRSILALIAFIIGFSIGLFVFGWGLTPVQFTGAGPQDLLPENQAIYIQTVADLYSHDLNQERVREAFVIWPEAPQTVCAMAQTATDQGQADRLTTVALILNGQGCTEETLAQTEEGGGNLGLILLILLLLLLVVAAGYYFTRMRGTGNGEDDDLYDYEDSSGGQTFAPVEAPDEEFEAMPIARFETRYTRGHDAYDDSFSIENSQGEFLGECGVGISETIGMDTPKNVTAFEIWLFDKNDIRTVTKVVMSEHAYSDEAIRAKLAPKGEPVLARTNETIVLETATLIINAEIVEMTYGTGSLPPESFLEHFTVELSAWAKSGDYSSGAGGTDQLLDY